jgi:hypothetical protein
MTKSVQFLLAISLSFFLPRFVEAQVKVEREYKIKEDMIPDKAFRFIHESGILQSGTKVNWYREEGVDEESVEAKFSQGGAKYSVEFSIDGSLQDLEMEIKVGDISPATMVGVRKALDAEFTKWKIKKVQVQWLGEEEEVIRSIKQGEANEELIENYEIVVKAQSEDAKSYFELLFDNAGALMRKSRIIENSSDILIY